MRIRIAKESIDKLLGKTTEVMVYGFSSCLYMEVCNALNEHQLNAYRLCSYPKEEFPDIGPDGSMRAESKSLITRLLILNYQRSKEGKALMPLIFCIANQNSTVNLQDIANNKKFCSNAELRRCYKSVFETSPEIRKIAEETIIFVKLQKIETEYHLVRIKPFWSHAKWPVLWNEHNAKKNRDKKANPDKYRWQKILSERVEAINRKIP